MAKARGLESWMVSNVAAGAASLSFVTLLLPPFITQVTGSAARSGVVLAVIGLAALSGPYIGRLADRKGLHRSFYVAGMFGMSLCFALLALDAEVLRYTPLIGILLGVCLATQGTIGPAFIVGSRQEPTTVARQLTAFSVLLPVGQVLGAIAVAIGLAAGLSAPGQFALASIVLALLACWTWKSMHKPAARLRAAGHHYAAHTHATPQAATSSRRNVYVSVFGFFMLVATLGAIANSGMTSQIANILPHVYGFSNAQTAGLIGMAGLLSVGAILLSGAWMRRKGPFPLYVGGSAVKWLGMTGMALIGLLGGAHLLLAALMVQIAYAAPLLTRTGAPSVASILAPLSAAEANGYYFATSALGAFLGSLAAGFLADAVGYNAINWLNAVLSGAALLLLLLILLPKAKAFAGLFTNTHAPGGQKGSA